MFVKLEIPLTLFVTAIAIQLDRVTWAFARRAAILLPVRRVACARRVLAFSFLSHKSSSDYLPWKMF